MGGVSEAGVPPQFGRGCVVPLTRIFFLIFELEMVRFRAFWMLLFTVRRAACIARRITELMVL